MKKYFTYFLPLLLSPLLAETITVSGKVVDASTKQPLTNVNIFHKQGGTSSNTSGDFKIVGVKQSDEIIFRYIGYEEISLTAREIGQIVYLSPISLQSKKIYVRSGLREVSLLDSPSSISILGKSNIDNEPLNHFQGLIQLIPNLNWAGGTSRPRYFQIRAYLSIEFTIQT